MVYLIIQDYDGINIINISIYMLSITYFWLLSFMHEKTTHKY